MKRTLFLTSIALMVMIGFASCTTDDERKASVLSGEWEGDWGMWYEDDYGYVWDAADTYIKFYREGYTSGTGLQVDYYRRGPYKYLYYKFCWSVDNGVITLTYPYDRELNTKIYDYKLNNSIFDGYFGSSDAYFTMDKVRDFCDWTPGYWYDDNHYYGWTFYMGFSYDSKEFQGNAKSKGYASADGQPKIVKRGGHFKDANNKR